MPDVCNKDLIVQKILKLIDYITSASKNKPTKEWIKKYMARSNLELQEKAKRHSGKSWR